MIRIALVLKNIVRRFGRGWPLRFKSNETGLLIGKCSSIEAQTLADQIYEGINELPDVPAMGEIPAFSFTGTVVWSVWPNDHNAWDNIFEGSNKLLLDTWRSGGNRIVHYTGTEPLPAQSKDQGAGS
jgi:hypothetical protein